MFVCLGKILKVAADKKLTEVKATAGKGRFRIAAEAKFIGEDIIISIWGGTKPHIGSIVVSVPRPSLKNSQSISVISSAFNFIGHKDEIVARMFSEKIAATLNRNTVTTAGIHVDNLTEIDIKKILKNAETLCSILIKKWRG
jgi:hypothetical protein